MRTIIPAIAIATAGLALTACGDEPDRAKRSDNSKAAAPGAGVVVAPATPAIHFAVSDARGNKLDLKIDCGADVNLEECAKVNRQIIDRVAQMRAQDGGNTAQRSRQGSAQNPGNGSGSTSGGD